MPVQTRSMTKAAVVADAAYFEGLRRRILTRQAEKKEAIAVATILVEMSTGSLTRVNEACARGEPACSYMEDKRLFVLGGSR